MATKLSEKMSKLIHRMDREREDHIFVGFVRSHLDLTYKIQGYW